MGTHIDKDGQFQSDKYPTCPPGKVPLSVKDKTAQDLLWRYAQRRRSVDAEFSSDLERALLDAGWIEPPAASEACILEDILQERIDTLTRLHGYGFDCEVFDQALAEIRRLKALINSPVVDDWLEGVRLEAAHQQVRWPSENDAGKTDPDWFWLVGYLAGKALWHVMQGNVDKAKHHTISTGAALLNWWRHICGEATGMRPGIEPPAKES